MSLFGRVRRLFPSREPVSPSPVRIVTDSTADLPPELAAELDITVVPLQVLFGEESFRDGVDLTNEQFFQRLGESSQLPTTSQPSLGEFQEVYEELATGTDRVLSIHLSSGFSGTAECARQAAAALADRCRIEVIDSETVSMALGFAVLAAAHAARDGSDLEACAQVARSVLARQRLAIALDTLEYLRRGGRIGRAQAFLGNVLRLKPILTIRDGEAYPLTRVRTRRKALDEIVRISVESGRLERATVMHTTTPDDADYVAQEISRRYPEIDVRIGRLGPVIGVHGGPGTIGLAIVLAEEQVSTEGTQSEAPV